jgi:hypothetical protein
MELDKELFNNLMRAYNESGPPDECAYQAEQYADCEEAQDTVSFLKAVAFASGDMSACFGAAIQLGFEIGLQYAQLKMERVKK